MMKKHLLIVMAVFSLALSAKAGEGDILLNAKIGAFYQKSFNGLLELEFERKYSNCWVAYLDLCNAYRYCEIDHTIFCDDTFWDYQTFAVGVGYKHNLVRWQNMNLRAQLGFDIGADYCKEENYSFYMSAEISIEMTFSLRNRTQLCLIQKNDFCFFTRDHFKNGLLIGIKIPLN